MRAYAGYEVSRTIEAAGGTASNSSTDGDAAPFRPDCLSGTDEKAERRMALSECSTGLAILEACCFVGAAGGVAGAVGMSAGAR